MALVLGALAAPRVTHASTVVPVTVETLAQRSDVVVTAIARATQSQWLGRMIVTDVDVEIQSVAKGAVTAGMHLVVRTPGGIVGRIGQRVPGVPAIAVGQTYMLFLRRATGVPSIFYLAHLTAAVLPVTTSPTGVTIVVPASEGMVAPSNATPTDRTIATVMRAGGVPIETVRAAVRSTR